ncbi:MAG: peptidoglycan editing factor PgeF [Azoarcus sp.]|jgi:YfiH family protein|nr:peptidoglycan editing factor PgeF [Azoarcus sp.]
MADFFLIPDWPAPPKVKALVTTRAFGNLADHIGDAPSAVAQRRAELRRYLPADPPWLVQVHGRACVAAESAKQGVEADALFAHSPKHVCAVLTADCLPVLLCDETGNVIAAVHAGWRGLADGIIESAVAAMTDRPERLLAWLGPAIGPMAFEVGEEVRAAFLANDAEAQSAFRAQPDGKWLCDLYTLARRRLARLGVARVFGGGRCTCTETDQFFSFRRDPHAGRMASLIWIV